MSRICSAAVGALCVVVPAIAPLAQSSPPPAHDSAQQQKPSTAAAIVGAILQAAVLVASQPKHVTLVAADAVPIKASEYAAYKFTVSGSCKITAHIIGVSGGQLDFVALLQDEDNFVNWQTGHASKVYWQTDKVAAATMDTVTLGSGTYYLVVSNRFSLFTPKVVNVQADALCGRGE